MDQLTKPCVICKDRPRMPIPEGKKYGSSYCRDCWNARCREYRRVNGHPKKKPQDRCSRCGENRDGKHPAYCAECWQAKRKERALEPCGRCGKDREPDDKTNSVYCNGCWRDWWLRRKYGITGERYEQMLESQGHRCAICRTEANGRQWHVDHCHATGRVRGILCDNCNRGLGHFGDDPARLRLAADYLEAPASL